ncbi:hypothetical protein Mgra_00009662 [Meloidogyne graminicola]|uniref:Uncharacterized protein n=1 Tax=Meloidogyne graminicola TaxID=189291 RepID=A0A8S9Z792_9BILA|nr:hypothetical protein Mgra_00009662 [Meloidogyne graminicola]
MLRGQQFVLICCIILSFTLYKVIYSKPKMEKDGMIIQVQLPDPVIENIIGEFNDINNSIHVWATLQLMGINANSTCQKCLEDIFAEANRLNNLEEKKSFFYFLKKINFKYFIFYLFNFYFKFPFVLKMKHKIS